MLKNLCSFFALSQAQKNFREGKEEKAIQILEKEIGRNPNYSFAYFHLAKFFLERRELDKAKTWIEKAIECKSGSCVYQTLLGIIYYDQKNYRQAQEAFEKALSLDKHNQLTHNYLSLCFLRQNDVETFQKRIQEKGIFESTDLQIRMMFAMEEHIENKKTGPTRP